ncbi:galactose-specific lectin nattectin-like [Pseudoliparis swirei]|uniref:galactose-specific lectin nattectin-like n=1 Tax=Pseudoliparis swirei TaxID=2059687 RepID=UPI0024BE0980|nr:galactose-specific lectin nattectin-like [Pseudoliparis swirei]
MEEHMINAGEVSVPEHSVPVPRNAPVLEEGAEHESYFSSCTGEWTRHGYHCFLFVRKAMSWYSAEELCNGLGGHLASATNPSEYSFLQQMTETNGEDVSWLGGFKLQDNWMWIDRQGFYYQNWFSPPSSSCFPCVNLSVFHGWGNTDCRVANRFTCSKSPFSC